MHLCLRSVLPFTTALFLSAPDLLASSAERTRQSPQTALDRYVAAPDGHYAWRLVNTLPCDGYTTYIVDMTSQAWLTTNEVNRTLWQHWLTIVKPDQLTSTAGLLFIGGGANKKDPPAKAEGNIITLATRSG